MPDTVFDSDALLIPFLATMPYASGLHAHLDGFQLAAAVSHTADLRCVNSYVLGPLSPVGIRCADPPPLSRRYQTVHLALISTRTARSTAGRCILHFLFRPGHAAFSSILAVGRMYKKHIYCHWASAALAGSPNINGDHSCDLLPARACHTSRLRRTWTLRVSTRRVCRARTASHTDGLAWEDLLSVEQ